MSQKPKPDSLPTAVDGVELRKPMASFLYPAPAAEEFRIIFESAAIGLAQADVRTRKLIRVNPYFCSLTGYSAEELMEMTPLDITHPLDRARDTQAIADIFASGKNYETEKRYLRKDGSTRWVHVKTSLICDSSGQPVRIFAVASDITERKHAEERVSRAEQQAQRLAHIIEATSDFVAIGGMDGSVIYINQAGRRLAGLSDDADLRTRRQADLCPQWVSERATQEWLPRALHHGSASGEGALLTADQREIPVSFVMLIHRDSNAQPEFISIIARDITEQKRAEQQLKATEQRLRQMIDSNAVGLLLGDFQGNILHANDSFLQIIGYTREDLDQGRINWIQLTPPEHRRLDNQAMETMRLSGRHEPFEKQYVRKDGSRVSVLVGTAFLPSETLGVGFIVDLTARKRAEAALLENQARERAYMEHLPVGVWFLDEQGKIVYGNTAGREIWKGARYIGHEEFGQYRAWWHGTNQMLSAEEWGASRAFMKGETCLNELIDIECFDGSRKTILNSAVPVRAADGKIQGAVVFNQDVTDRIRFEQALRLSNDRLQRAQKAARLGAWDWDLKTNTVTWSEGIYELLKVPHNSVEPSLEQWLQFILPEDLSQAENQLQQVLAAGGEFNAEFRIRRPDGQIRWVASMGRVELGLDGAACRALGVNIDVTQSKQAEAAVRESERRLLAFLDQLPVGAGLTDPNGAWLITNPLMKQFMGESIPSRDENGRSRWKAWDQHGSLLAPQDWPGAKALRGQTVPAMDFIYRAPSGEERWTRVSSAPFRDETGLVRGAVVILQDIDAEKRAELALRESEERVRQQFAELDGIYRTAPLGLGVLDRNLRFRRINDRLAEMNGFPAEAHIGKTVRELVPALVGQIEHVFNIILETGQPVRHEFRGQTPALPGAERIWDEYWYPLRAVDGSIDAVCVMVEEVTARKNTEMALVAAQKHLEEHAARLEQTVAERTAKLRETVQDLEAFSYSIAHDMRAPLRAMQGYAMVLKEDFSHNLDDDARKLLQKIAASAARLDQFIRDILDYSKVVRGELNLRPTNPHKLLLEIIDSYPQLREASADISLDGAFPLVVANEAALTQVFSNLLGNALKFVAPGVRPRVRIWAAPESPAANLVRIFFQDNGIGIAHEAQKRLFNIFTRLNQPGLYEGTGIGLAIVKKAVDRMGGRVGLTSQQGQGSCFWVDLPPAPGEPT